MYGKVSEAEKRRRVHGRPPVLGVEECTPAIAETRHWRTGTCLCRGEGVTVEWVKMPRCPTVLCYQVRSGQVGGIMSSSAGSRSRDALHCIKQPQATLRLSVLGAVCSRAQGPLDPKRQGLDLVEPFML